MPEIRVFDDTLYIPGPEHYVTIRKKTIESVRYFLRDERYTHILRTNLSSFYVWNRLLDTLASLPSERLYAGVSNKFEYNNISSPGVIYYASGAGFVMSRDVAQTLVKTPFRDYTRIDDVDIGAFLFHVNGYPVIPMTRCDEEQLTNDTAYHYRLRMDRTQNGKTLLNEVDLMYTLIQKHYSSS